MAPDVVHRSLLDSTSALFAQRAAGAPSAPAVAGGPGFGPSTGAPPAWSAAAGATVIRRTLAVTSPSGADGATSETSTGAASTFDVSRLPARDFQQLVDAIVDVLEQRVIDELERRGRRHPGVF